MEIVAVASYLPGNSELTILTNFTCFVRDEAAAAAALQPIHDTRPPGAKLEVYCQPTSLAKEYCVQGDNNPQCHRFCAEGAYIANDADVVSVLERAFTTVPTRKSTALYFAMNPTSRRPLADMACSMQSDHYFALYVVWEEEMDDACNVRWVQDVMREAERHAEGSYLGDADFRHRRTKFWSDEAAARLMAIRRKWDPEGRICGYLDEQDKSGVEGLRNEFEWESEAAAGVTLE